jgi:HEPN domain-containing protein
MRENIQHWWDQAQRDLVSAANSLRSGDYYVCVFLCQQAVEKGLKAYIMHTQRISPGQVHSLARLGDTARVPDSYRPFLRQLTTEYFLSRYPDAADDAPYRLYKQEDAESLLADSQEVLQWLATQMNK